MNLFNSNQRLDSLLDKEKNAFLADSEIVEMTFGDILTEPGEKVAYAFSPLIVMFP